MFAFETADASLAEPAFIFPVSHWNDMNIVIVESPAKAKTINKYLGASYEVLASFGHVRDLPAKNGSVDPEANFQMIWEIDPKAASRLNDIAKALKGADKLILATDPDREGEAISWHVLEVLKEKRALKDHKIERVVFNAITKQAVTEAMKNPRQIDGALVDAYMARRALDYLVGFTLSPVLWRKLPGARSAGRVQSVALRLVCDRELEIEKFIPREYWSLVATLTTPRGDAFEARLIGADGKKIQRLDIGTGAEAEDLKKAIEAANFSVSTVEAKPARRNPHAPFTTSTLQQEASSQARALQHGRRRCAPRSSSMRASTSVTRRTSASSPTCVRTRVQTSPVRSDHGHSRHGDRRGPLRQGLGARRRGRGSVQDQIEERAGSARSHPPHRSVATAGRDAPPPRYRPGKAL